MGVKDADRELVSARKIMERLVRMPPEPHKDIPKKRGVSKAARQPRRQKEREAS